MFISLASIRDWVKRVITLTSFSPLTLFVSLKFFQSIQWINSKVFICGGNGGTVSSQIHVVNTMLVMQFACATRNMERGKECFLRRRLLKAMQTLIFLRGVGRNSWSLLKNAIGKMCLCEMTLRNLLVYATARFNTCHTHYLYSISQVQEFSRHSF